MTDYLLEAVGNYYTTRKNGSIILAVEHITAGATDYVGADTSAEGTLNWFRKATRVSIHDMVDSDSRMRCLPRKYTAWHAANYNSRSIGQEIGTGQVDWRKAPAKWVKATLDNAGWAWAPHVIAVGLPLKVVTKAQVDKVYRNPAHKSPLGFIGHGALDPGNRADPGFVGSGNRRIDTFPWSDMFEQIEKHVEILNGGSGGTTTRTTTKGSAGSGTKSAALAVDGRWGKGTTLALQRLLGTPQDGIVSSQPSSNRGIILAGVPESWQWVDWRTATGSTLIRKMQGELRASGYTGAIDGFAGRGFADALVRRYGGVSDGVLGFDSWAVRRMQEKINKEGKW